MSTTSSPFAVGAVPDGFRLVAAGTGTAIADWGSDSFGSHEPFTVLAPDGIATSPDVVVVSITGFEGYQGGLAQASHGYLSDLREDIEVEGQPGMYTPAITTDDVEQWADLVVEVGPDIAVRVTSPSATLDDLRAVLRTVEVPEDRIRAPTVQRTAGGLEVVGSVDVDALLALDAFVLENTDQVPGGPEAHGAGWVRGAPGDAQLTVLSLPGASVDLEALPASAVFRPRSRSTWRSRSVGTRTTYVRESTEEGSGTPIGRSLWTTTAWGDVLVVGATGTDIPTEEELLSVADSVQRVEATEWEAFVEAAHGGPGLHADPGRVELARGETAGVGWLLQNGPPGGGSMLGGDIDPTSGRGVDPCLKLSTRVRACAGSGGGSIDDWIQFTDNDEGLSFVVVSTTVEAAMLRVITTDDEATVSLVPVPGGGLWAGVAFVDVPGLPTCPAAGVPPPSAPVMTVEALDAAGAVIGCLGFGGRTHSPG